MVFTRQFTAFDRQNRESAESPFHGFFILFVSISDLFFDFQSGSSSNAESIADS
jgi:hypothetical protein